MQGRELMREAEAYISPLPSKPKPNQPEGATHYMRFPLTNLMTLKGLVAVDDDRRFEVLDSFGSRQFPLTHFAYLKELS